MNLYKICFVVCYFGQLPDYFSLWLISCRNNPSVDFLIITDDKQQFEYPKNVKKVEMTFNEVKRRIQKNFDFSINLERVYKMCDFKPSYGEAFSDYLAGYDYWGYCDIDLIWGNIRHFLTEDILNKYTRILTRGHCSLFKNNAEVNRMYRTITHEGCQNYKEVFTSDKNYAFDEWAGHLGWGLSEILRRNNVKQYDEIVFLDCNFLRYRLFPGKDAIPNADSDCIVVYENKKIQAYFLNNGELEKKEFMYYHFQKRPPIFHCNLSGDFAFCPPADIKAIDQNMTKYTYKQLRRYRRLFMEPIKFRKEQIIKVIKDILCNGVGKSGFFKAR